MKKLVRIDKSKRKVDDLKGISYHETADEVFTLNIGCPHCKGVISLSLAGLKLEKIK